MLWLWMFILRFLGCCLCFKACFFRNCCFFFVLYFFWFFFLVWCCFFKCLFFIFCIVVICLYFKFWVDLWCFINIVCLYFNWVCCLFNFCKKNEVILNINENIYLIIKIWIIYFYYIYNKEIFKNFFFFMF